jgi:hypothetical protein
VTRSVKCQTIQGKEESTASVLNFKSGFFLKIQKIDENIILCLVIRKSYKQ